MHPKHQPEGTLVNVTQPLPALGRGGLSPPRPQTQRSDSETCSSLGKSSNPQAPELQKAKGSLQGCPAKPLLLQWRKLRPGKGQGLAQVTHDAETNTPDPWHQGLSPREPRPRYVPTRDGHSGRRGAWVQHWACAKTKARGRAGGHGTHGGTWVLTDTQG